MPTHVWIMRPPSSLLGCLFVLFFNGSDPRFLTLVCQSIGDVGVREAGVKRRA